MSRLQGIRFAVTRPIDQADELAQPLRERGAEIAIAPLIRICPAAVEAELREAILNLSQFDWVVFSSVNGVDLFAKAVAHAGMWAVLEAKRIAAVGPVTSDAAEALGLQVSVMPDVYAGDAIAGAMEAQGSLAGQRILLARAGGARSELPESLRRAGAVVQDVEVYHSVPDEQGARVLADLLRARKIDVVTLTSASAARAFAGIAATTSLVTLAAIGPATAAELRRRGLVPGIEAEPHTIAGLISAIESHFDGSR